MKTKQMVAATVGAVMAAGMMVTALAAAPGERRNLVETAHPLAAMDRSSPRATLTGFTDACNRAYEMCAARGKAAMRHDPVFGACMDRITSCLDLRELPEFSREVRGQEAALYLKEVLDRIPLPPPREIPDAKSVAARDFPLPLWTIPNTEITLVRVTEGPATGSYIFSPEAVAKAPTYFERVRHLPYKPGATEHFLDWYVSEAGTSWMTKLVNVLPAFARGQVGGMAAWQWLGVLIVAVLGALLMLLLYREGRTRRLKGAAGRRVRYTLTLTYPVLAMLVPLWVRRFIVVDMNVVGTAQTVVEFTANFVFLLAMMRVILGAGTRIGGVLSASSDADPLGLDAQFTKLLWRIISILAALAAFLKGSAYLGIPLAPLLAGAGVGGLAVALSAQDALKNVFGSIMIFLDKPFRIGERIQVKGYDGVVEEIGLRSTRIRLLTGHLTTIPNEQMAASDIENIGRRPHIRCIMDLPLPLDIGPEKAQCAVNICAEILKDHEGQEGDFVPRVFLSDFRRDHVNLRVLYWYHPPAYWAFVAFGQEVNKKIMERFAAAGIPFAVPTSKVFVEQGERTGLAGATAPGPGDGGA